MSDFTRLAGYLHTLSCTRPHADDMLLLMKPRDPTQCYYYLEEALSSEEEREDHQTWEREAEALCKELSTSPTEAIRLLNALLDLRRRLDDVLAKWPTGAKIAHLLLFDEQLRGD